MNNNMPSKGLLLIVEDDENMRLALNDNLEHEGYDIITTGTAQKAQDYINRYRFDLIVLDIMLPDGDGLSLCKKWRDAGVNSMILMLTALDQEDNMVAGFSCGADDYIVKPYQLRVLLSRIEALLRRINRDANLPLKPSPTLPGIHIDSNARRVQDDSGTTIVLTKLEYELLLFFILNKNRALSFDEIIDNVWGKNVCVVRGAVRNTVASLRKNLSSQRNPHWEIVAVRGFSYRMEIDE